MGLFMGWLVGKMGKPKKSSNPVGHGLTVYKCQTILLLLYFTSHNWDPVDLPFTGWLIFDDFPISLKGGIVQPCWIEGNHGNYSSPKNEHGSIVNYSNSFTMDPWVKL
jgi:hypothetical protein